MFIVFKGNALARYVILQFCCQSLRLYGLDCLVHEITLSYSLLFEGIKGAKVLQRIAKRPVRKAEPLKHLWENKHYNQQFSENIRPYYEDGKANHIQVFSWTAHDQSLRNFGSSRTPPSMTDFHIFGARLQELKRQMDLEQSRTLRDLFKPAARVRRSIHMDYANVCFGNRSYWNYRIIPRSGSDGLCRPVVLSEHRTSSSSPGDCLEVIECIVGSPRIAKTADEYYNRLICIGYILEIGRIKPLNGKLKRGFDVFSSRRMKWCGAIL